MPVLLTENSTSGSDEANTDSKCQPYTRTRQGVVHWDTWLAFLPYVFGSPPTQSSSLETNT